jgi:hypothetical protein
MLPLTVAPKRFEAVGRRSAQIVERGGGVEIAKLSPRYLDQICRKPLAISPLKAASVRAFLKLLITMRVYQSMIRSANPLYQKLIHAGLSDRARPRVRDAASSR